MTYPTFTSFTLLIMLFIMRLKRIGPGLSACLIFVLIGSVEASVEASNFDSRGDITSRFDIILRLHCMMGYTSNHIRFIFSIRDYVEWHSSRRVVRYNRSLWFWHGSAKLSPGISPLSCAIESRRLSGDEIHVSASQMSVSPSRITSHYYRSNGTSIVATYDSIAKSPP